MLATQCITACRHGQDNLKKFKRSIRTGKKRNQKLLVYWDFPTQLSLGFTENGAKKKKEEISSMWLFSGRKCAVGC